MAKWCFRMSVLIVLALALLACNNTGVGSYSFIDQNLQGKIGGVSWTWEGTEDGDLAEEGFGGNLTVEIRDITAVGGDPCAFGAFSATDYEVFFKVPKAPVDAVGLYELGFETGQYVTLYDGVTNYICAEGAVEILSVSATSGGLVTGRMDVTADENSTVNGNFTVTYCP